MTLIISQIQSEFKAFNLLSTHAIYSLQIPCLHARPQTARARISNPVSGGQCHSSHHPQKVLLAQFSLYVHKGGLKPDSFHFLAPSYSGTGKISHIQKDARPCHPAITSTETSNLDVVTV